MVPERGTFVKNGGSPLGRSLQPEGSRSEFLRMVWEIEGKRCSTGRRRNANHVAGARSSNGRATIKQPQSNRRAAMSRPPPLKFVESEILRIYNSIQFTEDRRQYTEDRTTERQNDLKDCNDNVTVF